MEIKIGIFHNYWVPYLVELYTPVSFSALFMKLARARARVRFEVTSKKRCFPDAELMQNEYSVYNFFLFA